MAQSTSSSKAENNISKRGFASMDRTRQREIASKGGKASHQSGNAHQFTSESAREAGRKGGKASRGSRKIQNTLGMMGTQS